MSPREVSGVGKKQRFDFNEVATSPESRPPAVQRTKTSDNESPPLPPDLHSLPFALHDRLIFQSELAACLLLCLKENKKVNIENYEFKIDCQNPKDPHERKFLARIAGVPQNACGFLWSAADDAARSSKVPAVQKEQNCIDTHVSYMAEEELQSRVVAFCHSIPTIRICPIGMQQDLERLTYQKFVDELVIPYNCQRQADQRI